MLKLQLILFEIRMLKNILVTCQKTKNIEPLNKMKEKKIVPRNPNNCNNM